MIDEVLRPERFEVPAVYFRGGRYVAGEYDGPEGLVCCVGGESRADDLARQYNEETEGVMAAKKNGSRKVKAEKVARVRKPKAEKTAKTAKKRDPRIPGAGTIIRKEYDGEAHEIRVNESDFTYKGDRFNTLSAISHLITGKKFKHGISGFVFFKKQLEEKTGV